MLSPTANGWLVSQWNEARSPINHLASLPQIAGKQRPLKWPNLIIKILSGHHLVSIFPLYSHWYYPGHTKGLCRHYSRLPQPRGWRCGGRNLFLAVCKTYAAHKTKQCYVTPALCCLRNLVWEKKVLKDLGMHIVLEMEATVSNVT